MAESSYQPGSRAIKIPISKLKNDNAYTTPARRRAERGSRMFRTDSTEGSSSSSDTASSLPSVRETLLMRTGNTVASPANTMLPPRRPAFQTPPQSEGSSKRKDKHRADSNPLPPEHVAARLIQSSYSSPLSPSMLSSSSYKSVNLNSSLGDDEPARLITYTKHSQGFTWNDELFLPSYLVGRRYRGSKARRRWGYEEEDGMDVDEDLPFDEEGDKVDVYDIFISDEEAAAMLP